MIYSNVKLSKLTGTLRYIVGKSKCYNYAGFLSEESWQDRSIMKSNHI